MSKRRIGKRNKIKRTSNYRGYNRFAGYRRYNSSNSSDSDNRSLGKAVAMAVIVVVIASLVIFLCVRIVPIIVDFSRKSFIQSTTSEPSETVSKVESRVESSKAENSKSEVSKNEVSKAESKPKENNGYYDNDVFIYKNKGYRLFNGSNETAVRYAESINEVAKTLDEGINIYSMIVPTHSSVALETLQNENSVLENGNIDKIYNSLSDNITFVDVKDALKENKDKYIYYNTDECWTSLGAYHAYQKYCKVANLTAINTDGIEKKKIENFFGSLIVNTKSDKNKNGNPDLIKNPDTVEYYTFKDYECRLWKTATSGETTVPFINEDVSVKNALDIFSYGDVSLFKIYTNKGTGKNLCIVKDSYGSAIVPYLTENYDEIHVIDSRFFEGSLTGYCYNHAITDVLFINGINNANTKDYSDAIFALSKENQ